MEVEGELFGNGERHQLIRETRNGNGLNRINAHYIDG